jgi:hypothetical protein
MRSEEGSCARIREKEESLLIQSEHFRKLCDRFFPIPALLPVNFRARRQGRKVQGRKSVCGEFLILSERDAGGQACQRVRER